MNKLEDILSKKKTERKGTFKDFEFLEVIDFNQAYRYILN